MDFDSGRGGYGSILQKEMEVGELGMNELVALGRMALICYGNLLLLARQPVGQALPSFPLAPSPL